MVSKKKIWSVALLILVTFAALPALADDEEDAKKLAGLIGAMDWCKDRSYIDDTKHGVIKLAILSELGDYEDRGVIDNGEILVTARIVEKAGLYRIWKLDRDRCESLMKLVELKAWDEILKDEDGE